MQAAKSISVGNEVFHEQDRYFGDYDLIRGNGNRLIGVSYMIDESDEVKWSNLASLHEGVDVEPGWLMIFFERTERYRIETLQGMFTRIYKANTGDYMLLIPDFLWMNELKLSTCAPDNPSDWPQMADSRT